MKKANQLSQLCEIKKLNDLDFDILKTGVDDLVKSIKILKTRLSKKEDPIKIRQGLSFILADVEALVKDAKHKKSGELVGKANDVLEKIANIGKQLGTVEFQMGNMIGSLGKLKTKLKGDDDPALKPGLSKVIKDLEKAEDDLVDLEKKIEKPARENK